MTIRRPRPAAPALRALLAALLASALAAPARAATPVRNSCADCHRESDEPRLRDPVQGFASDVHASFGFTCASCHGGDPTDPDVTAMDPDKGYRGAPTRSQVAPMCASCHANAAFMKRYDPRPYVFSVAEWQTSVHCKKESEGDTKVATCTGCHGVHGIRPHDDPASPVFKRNVPRTCAKCHNDRYMKGRPGPHDEFALYEKSVHGIALLQKGDVSAPACNDCHGNHGAAPPGLRNVTLVCATCHGREGGLFEGSRMKAGMDRMGKPGCVTCHGDHGIPRPTDAWLSAAEGGACAGCHDPGSTADRQTRAFLAGFHGLRASLAVADSLLALAEVRGMEAAPGRESMQEARDRLVGLRAGLHSFDPKGLDAALSEGAGAARRAADHGRRVLRDWHDRRVGMAVSLVVILVLIGALVARIRGMGGAAAREG